MPTLVQVQILTLVQVQVARRDLPPLFDKAESSFWLSKPLVTKAESSFWLSEPLVTKAESTFWLSVSKEARQVAAAIRRWEST